MCDSCLSKLPRTQCPFDQAIVETDVSKLPYNYALLQLVGVEIPDDPLPAIESVQNNAAQYRAAKRAIEELALFLQPAAGGPNGMVNGNSNGNYCNGSVNGNGNSIPTRPMQRKLVTLVNCQLAEADGRTRAMRAARSLGERTVTELILLHQNQQQLSANLWAAVRNRGCQFLGPAMQEEALKLILLALEGGEALSRKVLVLFVVQKLESLFPQASKTSIGHVVQLLYRASCFKVEKKNNESSLMQLKEQFRTYDALRKEHDAQIVQIATEAGLRILPDQWSSLLYGDLDHKSHMQSIIDKLQSPASFSQSIQELIIALQRSGDPGDLCQMRDQFEVLSQIDASPEAACPSWDELEQAMTAVHSVVHGLVKFSKAYGKGMRSSSDPPQPHNNNNKFKTSMCRDYSRGCPRGAHCTFAHSEEELERYNKRRTRAAPTRTTAIPRGSGNGAGADQYSPHGSVENGCDSSPTATQAPSNGVNGSARSSPHYVSGEMSQSTPSYGPPPQVSRRDSQEQMQMMTQRMKQMTMQSPQSVYQSDGYCAPRSPYDHVQSYVSPSGSERGAYFQYYTSSTAPPGSSYSNVVSRGKDVTVGVMTPPRNSPLTVQDDGINGINGICGMNGMTNGHVDHHSSLYNGRAARPRRDMAPIQSQPPGSYHSYDHSYHGYPSDPTGYYSPQADFYNASYAGRTAMSYEHVHQGVMGYPYIGGRDYYCGPVSRPFYDGTDVIGRGILMQRRSPYIPSDLHDEKNPDSSPRGETASDCDFLDLWIPPRKDTTLSSASSGVSSGSPLSHSPAASQSSNSSLSPRQQSPVGWQHGNEADFMCWRNLSDDNNALPPPPGITDTAPIWSPHHGNEVRKFWPPLIDLDEWSRKEEQIKKDEQVARALQEQFEHSGCPTPPETRGNDLSSQTRDSGDQQGSEQVRRGQDASDRGLTLDSIESEAEIKRRKKAEHMRMVQESRKLLQQQERDKQEREDRKFAEELAFRDVQQAGLAPDPRCIMKPYPNVISRGAPMGLGFSSKGESEIRGEYGAFSGLSSFRGSCASSLADNDEVNDTSKMTSGCSGDIRVQE